MTQNYKGTEMPETDDEWLAAFDVWADKVGHEYTMQVISLGARIAAAMKLAGLLDQEVPLEADRHAAVIMARTSFVASEALCDLGMCPSHCKERHESEYMEQ